MGKKIVFRGAGPYLGPLITDTFQANPDATLFDQSNQAKAGIEQEQKLVDLGYVDRSTVPKNGKVYDPKPSANPDLIITFDGLNVVMEAHGGVERVLCPKLESFKSLEDFNSFIAGLAAKANRLLNGTQAKHPVS